MLPTFKSGDQVVTFNWLKPKAGNVVVFKKGGINMVKRVVNIESTRIYVEGDNAKESSRVGWIDRRTILGIVVFRLN